MVSSMNVVAIVQARMGSTRLPGKVMLDIEGQPMLARVIERARRIPGVDLVVIATTRLAVDEVIVDCARHNAVEAFCGDEDRVLDRYYNAARCYGADVVARITADCPLLDSEIAGRVVSEITRNPEVDFAANTLRRTYPRGLDVEAASFATIERLFKTVTEPHHREHVFPYIYEHRDQFNTRNVAEAIDHSWMRWTVDTPEDLEFVRAVYRALPNAAGSDWKQILDVLDRQPQLLEINKSVIQKALGSQC
jgi:spore coat polysaccharide biosynthesis protein SpsF